MPDMTGDILIRGGWIIDPAAGFSGNGDVLIGGNKIIGVGSGSNWAAQQVIEARGALVLPGLIDYHVHVFHGGTEIGIQPDAALLPQGVTTAVDQGSAGVTNYASFANTVVHTSQVKIFSYLHASPAGLSTLPRCLEPVNPKYFNAQKAVEVFTAYSGQLLGLKIRQSQEIVGEWGIEPLRQTVKMAEELGCPVVVHTTNPPGDVEELLSLLRPGDVFTHVYQGKGSSILGENGKVRPAFKEAREKGIIFCTADGRGHYTFAVAKAAIADGFEPDLISTDLVRGSLFQPAVFGLPLIMSKYLALGMALDNVVRACTAAPAQLLGKAGELGTLQVGAAADVAIFKLKDKAMTLRDLEGEEVECQKLLIPQLTIANGRLAYRSLDF